MIEGTMVNLRAMERGDLERAYTWINDGDVTRHLNMRYPMPHAAEEAWVNLRTGREMGYVDPHFAVETKDGEHIGLVAFHRVVPESRAAELGIMIGDKRFWSKGYGTDTVRTIVRFAFDEMDLERVWLRVHADNPRAQAAYRRAGFIDEGCLRQATFKAGKPRDVLVMGVLRGELR